MNHSLSRLFLRYLGVLFLIVFSAPGRPAEKAVSEDTYKILKEADDFLRQGQASQALRQLRALQPQTRDKPFDQAVVQQYLAYAHAGANDFRAARQAAKAALDSKQLDADAEHGLHYLAGQAAFQLEAYRDSVSRLEQWLQNEPKADADIHYMAGYAAYQAKLTQSAIRHLEKAVALQKTPPSEWTQLLLSLYIDRKEYAKAEPIVKRLIASSPDKREWWRYLSSLYAQQDRYDRALSTMMLAYYLGEVRQEDVLQLVKLHAQQGYPIKAARMLEAELESKRIPRNYKNLKLLFSCWQLAREHKQASRILTEAAALAPNGEDFMLSGRLAMQRGDWTAAKKEFQKSLRKGGLKREEFARLWLGVAAFKSEDESLARQSLEPLLGIANVKQEAAFWLERIEKAKSSHTPPHQPDHPSS